MSIRVPRRSSRLGHARLGGAAHSLLAAGGQGDQGQNLTSWLASVAQWVASIFLFYSTFF